MFNNRGFTALLTVIIVGAAALLMVVSAALLSLGELDLGYISQKGSTAFAIADGCAEEALYKIHKLPTYTGESLSLGGGTCTTVVSGTNQNKTITVAAIYGQYYKNILITASLQGRVITITSWEETSS